MWTTIIHVCRYDGFSCFSSSWYHQIFTHLFNLILSGVLFMSICLLVDSIGQNFQERVLIKTSPSEQEIVNNNPERTLFIHPLKVFYNGLFGSIFLFIVSFFRGELIPGSLFLAENPTLFLKIFVRKKKKKSEISKNIFLKSVSSCWDTLGPLFIFLLLEVSEFY
jgi:hypothetical protein